MILATRIFFVGVFALALGLTLAGIWVAILTANAPQFVLLGIGLLSLVLARVALVQHQRWRKQLSG